MKAKAPRGLYPACLCFLEVNHNQNWRLFEFTIVVTHVGDATLESTRLTVCTNYRILNFRHLIERKRAMA